MGMTSGLAAAITRHVFQDFRMLAGKLVHRAGDIDRPARSESGIWNRRRNDPSRRCGSASGRRLFRGALGEDHPRPDHEGRREDNEQSAHYQEFTSGPR